MIDIVELYRKIWTLADELAEKETGQFPKNPPPIRKRAAGSFVAIKQSREEYKDSRRDRHVMEMMSILRTEEEEE